jgi:XTP/dITP diphosphohydrolase
VVAQEASGAGGFGYDPVFYLPDLGKTMAQLLPEEKNGLSHRGKALKGFKQEWEKKINGTDQ